MTEVYVPNSDANSADRWPEALDVAGHMNNAMAVGDFQAYVWWYIRRQYGPMKEDGNVSKRGYMMAHFSKFVRPGYVRVDATKNPTANVEVSAYKKDDSKVVIVAINKGTSNVSQNFNMQNNSSYKVSSWVTTGAKNLAKSTDINAVNGNFTATLLAQSVTTFVADLNGNTATSTPTMTPTLPAQSAIEVTYGVSNNWGTGASINVTIKNNGTTPINGWNLVMALPSGQSVSSLWNASYTTSGSNVTVTSSAYNGLIAANGGTQSFGFNLDYSGTFSKPSSIKLNGIPCTIK